MPTGSLFSLRAFLLSVLFAVVGVVLGGILGGLVLEALLPGVGSVGRFVGLFLAGGAVAGVLHGRHYVETGIAGAIGAGSGFVLQGVAAGVVAGAEGAVAGVGITTGGLVMLAGHSVGRALGERVGE